MQATTDTTLFFHISDVLSIITGRCISTRGITGIYDIAQHLIGYHIPEDIPIRELSDVLEECQLYLIEQYPQFNTPAMEAEYITLGNILDDEGWQDIVKMRLAKQWLDRQ
ncbi:MAG: hypothetical protein NT091_03685, partial [Candidatus Falkowbacteria bacterium]|nr:hypothetical protein [Candidatus Falkowbacteria bacterium]